jgi:nicotinamidase-related amidase
MRAKNQPLWQVHPQIAPKEKDRIIVKYHADSFFETDLHALLQKDGITDIIVCGVQTEFCVDTTIRSAFSHGYHSH